MFSAQSAVISYGANNSFSHFRHGQPKLPDVVGTFGEDQDNSKNNPPPLSSPSSPPANTRFDLCRSGGEASVSIGGGDGGGLGRSRQGDGSVRSDHIYAEIGDVSADWRSILLLQPSSASSSSHSIDDDVGKRVLPMMRTKNKRKAHVTAAAAAASAVAAAAAAATATALRRDRQATNEFTEMRARSPLPPPSACTLKPRPGNAASVDEDCNPRPSAMAATWRTPTLNEASLDLDYNIQLNPVYGCRPNTEIYMY